MLALLLAFFYDMSGCRTFGTIDHLETDAITFLERFETVSLYGRMMDEDIFATILGDEAKSFRIIKPFYSSFSHVDNSSLVVL